MGKTYRRIAIEERVYNKLLKLQGTLVAKYGRKFSFSEVIEGLLAVSPEIELKVEKSKFS